MHSFPTSVSVTFSEAMASATVTNASNWSASCTGTGTYAISSVSLSGHVATVNLSQTVPVGGTETCTLTASTSITDAAGNALGGTRAVAYTIASLTDGSSTAYSAGSGSGTTWSTNKITLDSSGSPTNTAELDATWAPEWGSLVSYWKMNNDWNDSKGAANGTSTGGASFIAVGRIGSYDGSFDGTTGYVTFPDAGLPSGNSDRTVSAWVKYAGSANSTNYFFSYGTRSTANGFALDAECVYDNTHQLRVVGFNNDWNTNYILPLNIWKHIVVVHANTTTTLYVDGVQQDSTSSSTYNTLPSQGVIGAWDSTAEFFGGELDDIAVWASSLSAAEVQNLYSRQSAKYSGQFISRAIDYGAATAWTSLSWLATLPFGKELPDGGGSESSADYPSLVGSTGSTTDNNLMSGLVGLWHLNETSASGGSPNDFNDGSGNGHHGEQIGTVGFGVPGIFGRAASFDGSSCIAVDDATDFHMTQEITISAWVSLQTATGKQGFVSKSTNENWGDYVLSYIGGSLCIYMTGTYTCTSDFVPGGPMRHVVATYDHSNVRLYLDGVQKSIVAYTGNIGVDTAPLYIGCGTDGGSAPGFYHKGLLDEVAIWNRGLNATEVLQLYRRGANRIRFQVRTCSASDCSDHPTWLGPDGSNQTYFSELQNNSTLSPAGLPAGMVLTGSPLMLFSNFVQFWSTYLSPAQYIQYRAILESDDTGTSCGGSWCSPELKSVTVAP